MSFFSKFASLFTAIVRPDRSAYTTVIYPNRGKAVVVHDGLGIRHEHACDQSLGSILGEGVEVTFSFDDYAAWSEPDAQAQADNFMINPVNGMPMMDSCFDVMGNPYGMDALGDRLYFDHEATIVRDTSSPFDPD